MTCALIFVHTATSISDAVTGFIIGILRALLSVVSLTRNIMNLIRQETRREPGKRGAGKKGDRASCSNFQQRPLYYPLLVLFNPLHTE